jgi:UDP-N-acetylmuramyl tripeptide synthase
MQTERLARASTRLQAWRHGVQGRRRFRQAAAEREENKRLAHEYEVLIVQVRAENVLQAEVRAREARRTQDGLESRTIVKLQAQYRGVTGRRAYLKRKDEYDVLVGLDVEFRGLMWAARQYVEGSTLATSWDGPLWLLGLSAPPYAAWRF